MKSKVLLPMKILCLYIFITIIMFLAGPVRYDNVDNIAVASFMLLFILIASLFYYFGIQQKINLQRANHIWSYKKILHYSLIYTFFLQLLLVIQNSMVHGVSLSSFIGANYFQQMAEAYSDMEVINTPASWLMSYTGWVKLIALIGASYFPIRQQPKVDRVLYYSIIVLIILNVVLFVGSQKQLVDIFAYMLVPTIIKLSKSGKKIKVSHKVKVIILVVGVAFMLGSVVSARYDLWKARYNSSGSLGYGIHIDYNNFLYKIFPGVIASSIAMLDSYLTQGYRGLSLCLKLPFKWAYGMGSSFKLMNDISRWFHIPIQKLEVSYPVRMQETFGVPAYAHWHSIFPWLASDFTWIGAIFVVGIFVYYWGKAWKELRYLNSFAAVMLFTQLTIFMAYIPCNNQLFQTRESIMSTMAICIIWFLYHGNRESSEEDYYFEE